MVEATEAFIRAHRNNIQRYRRLLRTRLSELERTYIERRLAEETAALDTRTSPTRSEEPPDPPIEPSPTRPL
jgi:hypothetical protein